jgi:CW-type Zinc Finger.
MLPPSVDIESLPDQWFCHMNNYDKDRSTCNAKEETKEFMVKFFQEQEHLTSKGNQQSRQHQQEDVSPSEHDFVKSSCANEQLMKMNCDEVLAGLLKIEAPSRTQREKESVRAGSSQTPHKLLITKYFFHDSLTRPANVA